MSIKEKIEDYDKETQNRINTCIDCKHFNHKLKICGICKCFMPIKILIPNARCPVEKW